MKQRLEDYNSPYLRLVLGGQALIGSCSSIANPNSTLHDVAKTIDGSYLTWISGILGALALLDLIINDIVPRHLVEGSRLAKFKWHRTWLHRHWLFIGIAGCYLGQIPFAEFSRQSFWITLVCAFWCAMNILAAFIDAGDRSRRLWWQTMSS